MNMKKNNFCHECGSIRSNATSNSQKGNSRNPLISANDLLDRIVDEANILLAVERVDADPQLVAEADCKTVCEVCRQLQIIEEREGLRRQLLQGGYFPEHIRTSSIGSNGQKHDHAMGIVRDQIVQRMIMQGVDACLPSAVIHPFSNACQSGRSVADTIAEADRAIAEGHLYAFTLNLKSLLVHVPLERLTAKLQRRIADGRVVRLVASFLTPVTQRRTEWNTLCGSACRDCVLVPWLASMLYADELGGELNAWGIRLISHEEGFTIFAHSHEGARRIREHVVALIVDTMGCPASYVKPRITVSDRMTLLGLRRRGDCWRFMRDYERAARTVYTLMLKRYEAGGDRIFVEKGCRSMTDFLDRHRGITNLDAEQFSELERWTDRMLLEAVYHRSILDARRLPR